MNVCLSALTVRLTGFFFCLFFFIREIEIKADLNVNIYAAFFSVWAFPVCLSSKERITQSTDGQAMIYKLSSVQHFLSEAK